MNNKVKDVSIKNHTYHFFNGISEIKRLTNKLASKCLQKILIDCIGYVTMKYSKYVKINSVNPLYLIFSKMNGHLDTKEINKNKYLALIPSNQSKEKKINVKNCRVKSEI